MTLHIEDEIKAAWSALTGDKESTGWLTVPVSATGTCKVMAARRFPENVEAILVGFELESSPAPKQLPKGKGFSVEVIYDVHLGSKYKWLGLVKLPTGSEDIFLGMIGDILDIVGKKGEVSQASLFSIFLGRIRAWQVFMSRPNIELSSESEIGLFGELCMLEAIFHSGVESTSAVDAWEGPLNGLQDFRLGHGAVEVKTTTAAQGLSAKIFSIDQLDDSIISPLFLSAVRLKVSSLGKTLPMMIKSIRTLLLSQPIVLADFNSRLLRAGYLDSHADFYKRFFIINDIYNIIVDSSFPRLIKANVPADITAIKYEINIDSLLSKGVSLDNMLNQLGVI
jgi:hypothetical protein